MEGGDRGVVGVPVQRHVAAVRGLATEAATIPHHLEVARIVLVLVNDSSIVQPQRVQVHVHLHSKRFRNLFIMF